MTDAVLQIGSLTKNSGENPLVPISTRLRFLVLIYFVFWRFVPVIAELGAQSSVNSGYAMAIAIASFSSEVLLMLPFFIGRFAGTPIGWLHPLILPTAVVIAFGFLLNPASVLLPFSIWSEVASVPQNELMTGWPLTSIFEAQLVLNLLNLIALLCTYAGFAVALRSRLRRPYCVRINGVRLAILFLLSFLIVLFFLQRQGGVITHMSAFANGRFRMRELSGHFLVINAFLPYLLLLWYVYKPNALRNILFVAAFAAASGMQFVVTGSRSGLFLPMAMLLAVWIYHNQKLPTTRGLLLGIVAALSLGVLGEVRNSGRSGQVDFSTFLDLSVANAWQKSQQELVERKLDTSLPIVALVPDLRDHLYGTTYIAAVAFWVPRSLWPEKPRGAGAHVAALLFGGRETIDGYEGGGYPVDGVAEAYWNFGVLGVVSVFLLYGLFLGVVTRFAVRNPDDPFSIIILVAVSFDLPTPATTHLVPLLQTSVLLFVTYFFVARLQIKK